MAEFDPFAPAPAARPDPLLSMMTPGDSSTTTALPTGWVEHTDGAETMMAVSHRS